MKHPIRDEDWLAGEERMQYRVLDALVSLGGRVSFQSLRSSLGCTSSELRDLLAALNARGFVAGRPVAEGKRRPMTYAVTQLGAETLLAYRSGMVAILRLNARIVGLDRVPDFRNAHPWLFKHDPDGRVVA